METLHQEPEGGEGGKRGGGGGGGEGYEPLETPQKMNCLSVELEPTTLICVLHTIAKQVCIYIYDS